MRKPGKIFFLVAATILLATLTTTVVAYMFRTTEEKNNQFSPAKVSCEVHEQINSPLTEKTGVTVKNTGNIDAYLRVRFVSYWIDAESKVANKSSEMPTFEITEDWIAGADNTYYYKMPVSPGMKTGELLASEIVLSEEDGYKQVIDVFAEAIQSKPDGAVQGSWGVTLDANGNILAVS